MPYEGKIYRPPSEANSLLIQVTSGCSHNSCTFCNMFKDTKFRIKPLKEIFQDLEVARQQYSFIKRIFLIDGDALVLRTAHLAEILEYINKLFPECQRVGLSSTSMDIIRKSEKELIHLRNLGLGIIYLGVETGCDELLIQINKGVDSRQIIQAGQKVKNSGIKLSVSVISGLGGKKLWQDHAIETARVLSSINPDYIGLLTLVVEENSELQDEILSGKMTLLSPIEIMHETHLMISNLELTNSIFRGNHASNYMPFAATLGREKTKLLSEITSVINNNTTFKDDSIRCL